MPGWRSPSLALLVVPLVATACTTGAPQPSAAIPRFSADDPSVQTAGFIGQTLRLHREHDGEQYTLMAFEIEDAATLGAMVKGTFAGTVRWQVGDRLLTMPFDTAGSLRDVAVHVEGAGAPSLAAQGASFRGITWLNVEVPGDWVVDGTSLRLTFEPQQGEPVALPAEGSYRVHVVDANAPAGDHGN